MGGAILCASHSRESEHTPMTLYDQVTEAADAIRAHSDVQRAVGIILGSGLGDLANEVQDARAIPYTEIPHFLRSTVHGHAGRLLLGMLEEMPVRKPYMPSSPAR